jgi:hypothetical protein
MAENVVIIGSGPAHAHHRGGNYPGFPEGVSGPRMMPLFEQQAVRALWPGDTESVAPCLHSPNTKMTSTILITWRC